MRYASTSVRCVSACLFTRAGDLLSTHRERSEKSSKSLSHYCYNTSLTRSPRGRWPATVSGVHHEFRKKIILRRVCRHYYCILRNIGNVILVLRHVLVLVSHNIIICNCSYSDVCVYEFPMYTCQFIKDKSINFV